nr:hypothetical protein [uncultured Pseudomonas sp.]
MTNEIKLASSVPDANEYAGLPKEVVAAIDVDFPVSITGYLCNVEIEGYCAIGVIFRDGAARFRTGATIRTSSIVSCDLIQGYVVLETLNSWYVACSWAAEAFTFRSNRSVH